MLTGAGLPTAWLTGSSVHALQEQQLAQMELQSSAKQKFIANLRAKLENAELETEQLKYKLQQK